MVVSRRFDRETHESQHARERVECERSGSRQDALVHLHERLEERVAHRVSRKRPSRPPVPSARVPIARELVKCTHLKNREVTKARDFRMLPGLPHYHIPLLPTRPTISPKRAMAGHVVAGAAAASRAAKRAKPLPPPSLEAEAARKQSLALVTMQYKNWDVVWARMTGFPWWPGVVFHGWDVVEAAGLPLPRDPPVLAPPEKREVVVTGAGGKLERRIVVDRSCLVMFLDKGDWSALNMNTQVMPFTLGYAANSKPTHKRAKTSGFRLALQRALRLIHTVRV